MPGALIGGENTLTGALLMAATAYNLRDYVIPRSHFVTEL